VPLVLTTPDGAERLGGAARGLAPWASTEVGGVRVTAVPAVHGPDGAEAVLGAVTGFWLDGDGLASVYVSGDNASLGVVEEVAARFGAPDVAVLFAGGARREELLDGALLTLDARGARAAADVLGPRVVVPIHIDGWAHLSDPPEAIVEAFADRPGWLRPVAAGQRAVL
jgi:L-ascorbate metabolism protein UlaG (beta-lactamase superfamily)